MQAKIGSFSDCGSSPQVRFSPNMCCHTWLASGGRPGLVRLTCLRALIGSPLNAESKGQSDAPSGQP